MVRSTRDPVYSSIREAVSRLIPEATARGPISVRDSLVAALLTMRQADVDRRRDRLLETCDLHHDSLDEQPDEYLGVLHDVLCEE